MKKKLLLLRCKHSKKKHQGITSAKRKTLASGFTLVEMLMALLIVSVILSASLPIISQRQKAMASNYNQNRSFPIGGVILWTDMNKLPDNTWMECNGTALPNGIEYEQARRVFGANLPDLRNTFDYSTSLNNYLKTDLKNYLQTNVGVIPQNLIGIWGSNDAIPSGWSEAAEYRGVFLRGYGSLTHTQNNGSTIGNTATNHSSGAIGAIQGDAIRNIDGYLMDYQVQQNTGSGTGVFRETTRWSANNYIPNTCPPGVSYCVLRQGINIVFNTSYVVPTSNEIRPVNKAVRYIKYTNASTLPDVPNPPSTTANYRFIAKVRY